MDRKRFQEMYKTLGRRSSVSKRLSENNKQRQTNRNALIMSRRNISTGVSPLVTTHVETPVEKKIDARKERLLKWQQEKKQRMATEAKNKKPIFKVYHVTHDTNLDTVYGEIKGQPIIKKEPPMPPSRTHTFRPPANIKPVRMVTRRNLRSNVEVSKKSQMKNELSHSNCKDNQFLQSTSEMPKVLKKTTISSKTDDSLAKPTTMLNGDNDGIKKPESPEKILDEKTILQEIDSNINPIKDSSSMPADYPLSEGGNITDSVSTSPKTPDNGKAISVVYVSPFVTMSRGKTNARNEYKTRLESEVMQNDSSSTSPEVASIYFSGLLNNEIVRLQESCQEWKTYKETNDLAEEACNMINVVIGQTELLLTKKFQQFKRLIEICKIGDSEKPVTCLDLHGFWDMLNLQVSSLDKRFENLHRLKLNNWEEVLPEPTIKKPNKPKKKRIKNVPAKNQSSIGAFIEERRKKVLQSEMAQNREESGECSTNQSGECFTNQSGECSTNQSGECSTNQSGECSTNQSGECSTNHQSIGRTLSNATPDNKRISLSASLVMKITRSVKSIEQSTLLPAPPMPPRSILKSRGKTKLNDGKAKVVLFQDDESHKTNGENDYTGTNTKVSSSLINEQTPRRSKRLSERHLNRKVPCFE